MKQRLGVALSILFISGACFAMGMVSAWVDPILMRQDVARVGSESTSILAGAGAPAEAVSGYTVSQTSATSQTGVLDTGLATDASSPDGGLDPWLPMAVALFSGVIVIRISCLRQDAS